MKTLFNPRTALIIAMALLCNTCAKDAIDVFGSITGVVKDVQQQPIEGVIVSLNPGGVTRLTGKDGSYSFIDLESKQYSLSYSKNEYVTVSKTTAVQAAMNNVIDVILEKEKLVPVLAVSTKALDFGPDKTTLSLEISNTGKAALNWKIDYSPSWFTCSPSIGTVAAGGKSLVVITASRSQKEKGPYNGAFYISSDGGNCNVAVAMTVGGVGLSITQASLDFGSIATERQLTLTNTGATAIDYTAEASNSWIILPKTSGKLTATATDNLTVMVNRESLSAGDYTDGSVTIHAGAEDFVTPVRMSVPANDKPSVSMEPPRDITATKATFRGAILSVGKDRVTSHGFCWSVSPNPTINNNKSNFSDSSIPKSFESTATDLQEGTTYYVKAYAQNSVGIAYTNEQSFTTVGTSTAPVVVTGSVSGVTASSAQAGGTVANLGHSAGVTKYGHVWSVSPNPTTSSKLGGTNFGALYQTASYTSSLTDLSPGTTYYVRAYATNAIGTAYGEERSFNTQAPTPQLTIPEILTFGASETGSKAVAVEANVAWTATKDASTWFTLSNATLSNATGSNDGQFTVTVSTPNPGSTPRQGTITVTGGGVTKTITITQFGTTPQIEVSATSIDFRPDETASKEVAVTSNVAWTASKMNNAAWLTITVTSGKITIKPTANTGASQRSEAITVAGGGATQSITVTQAAPQISLAETSVSFGASETGSRSVGVTSNVAWTAAKDPATASWITITSSGAAGGQPLTITANSVNTTTSPRTVTITVKGGGATKTITVTQLAAAQTITLSPTSLSTFAASSPTGQSVSVTSNVNWTATKNSSDTWITITNGSGTAGTVSSFTVTVATNTSTSQRSGTITVAGGGASQSITVTQAGAAAPTITLSPASLSTFAASSPAGQSVSVTANVNWTATKNSSDTWITITNGSGTAGTVSSFTVTVATNTTTSQRSGTITVSGGSATQSITVTQAGATAQTITLSPASLSTFAASSPAAQSVSVTSNVNWTATKNSSDTWITITNGSGTAGTVSSFTVTVATNDTTSQRSGTITVSGGSASQSITVTQAGTASQTITLSPTSLSTFGYNEMTPRQINVTCYVYWIAQTDSSWIILDPAIPAANSPGSFTVGVETNTSTSQRSGTITVSGGSASQSITVTQAGAATVSVAVTSVSLNQTTLSKTVGDPSVTLTATVSPSTATNKSVNWSTSNSSVATVANGVVSFVGAGNATITVTTVDGGKTASCNVTVTAATVAVTGVSLNQTSLNKTVGASPVTLTATISPSTATNKNVSWSTGNSSVATVSTAGVVSFVGVGSTNITVTTQDGNKTATCNVTVTAATVPVTSVSLNQTSLSKTVGDPAVTLTATVNPSNATNKSVNWSTSNSSVATVANGVVSFVGAGNAAITVTTVDGGKTATCNVTVTAATVAVTSVSLNQTSLNKTVGDSPVTLTATISPSTATNKSINWSTSNSSVATVSTTGAVNFIKVGTAVITVTTEDGNKTATCNVTVGVGGYTASLTWLLTGGTLTISGTGSIPDYGSNHDLYTNRIPWYNYRDNITTVNIQDGVTTIGYGAFYRCGSLTSITIPNSVTTIGQAAFSDCTSLTSITIPNSVTTIGNHAFSGCSSLTSITIPNSVTSIGNWAFYGCSSLASITIPNSVTTIEYQTFYQCSSLTSITIPNSVTSIGYAAFAGCSSLTSITIPNSVTTIGTQAFYGCSSLTSITIPNSVTTIEVATFSYCSSLTSITIPNSVTTIGYSAFASCTNLRNVMVLRTTPPSINSGTTGYPTFDNVTLSSATLTVPQGSKPAYQAANGWKNFGTIVEATP